jgi:hypothetical protein
MQSFAVLGPKVSDLAMRYRTSSYDYSRYILADACLMIERV